MDERLLTQACQILTVGEGTADVYGDATETTATSTTSCHLELVKSQELGDRNVEESRWRVFLPGSVSLRGTDRLTINGSVYALDGDPWPAIRPLTGLVDHVEAVVRRLA